MFAAEKYLWVQFVTGRGPQLVIQRQRDGSDGSVGVTQVFQRVLLAGQEGIRRAVGHVAEADVRAESPEDAAAAQVGQLRTSARLLRQKADLVPIYQAVVTGSAARPRCYSILLAWCRGQGWYPTGS